MLKTICFPINITIEFIMALVTIPRTVLYMKKYATLYPYLKASMNYRLHNYYHSREEVLGLTAYFEDIVRAEWVFGSKAPADEILELKRLLCTLYCDLLKLHMMQGDIELATLVVIRANQYLDIDRLPNMPDFDLRTAHVVKAGIAAGRLLESGGSASLIIRSDDTPIVHDKPKPTPTPTNGSPLKKGNILQFRKKPNGKKTT